jgi:hypothetical protein
VNQLESHIQIQCVNWFRLQHAQIKDKLISIPNGGLRNVATGARLKREGAKAGVWDLLLLMPNEKSANGGLFIEIKTPTGKLSKTQSDFFLEHRDYYAFAVCRSLDEFINAVNGYLK